MDIKHGYKIEMSNNPICIEFIGIWGSGKTTLINEISKKVLAFKKSYEKYFDRQVLFHLYNPSFRY